MHEKFSKSQGYTLVELIVVFVIVVALFLASFPVYIKSREKIEFSQTINNIKSFVGSAVDLSSNPSSVMKNADGVCVNFNKNLTSVTYSAKPIAESSCVKAKLISSLPLSNDYKIKCDQCEILLPLENAIGAGRQLSATVIRGGLERTFEISQIGVVNVK